MTKGKSNTKLAQTLTNKHFRRDVLVELIKATSGLQFQDKLSNNFYTFTFDIKLVLTKCHTGLFVVINCQTGLLVIVIYFICNNWTFSSASIYCSSCSSILVCYLLFSSYFVFCFCFSYFLVFVFLFLVSFLCGYWMPRTIKNPCICCSQMY